MSLAHKLGVEFLGTIWLVFGGCGSAILAATFPQSGIRFVGGWALAQLWLFWVAPLIGGVLGGFVYRWFKSDDGSDT